MHIQSIIHIHVHNIACKVLLHFSCEFEIMVFVSLYFFLSEIIFIKPCEHIKYLVGLKFRTLHRNQEVTPGLRLTQFNTHIP